MATYRHVTVSGGRVVREVEVTRVGNETKARVRVPDGDGQLRGMKVRDADAAELKALAREENQEAYEIAKEERAAIIETRARNNPEEVTEMVAERRLTVAEAKAAGWTPPARRTR